MDSIQFEKIVMPMMFSMIKDTRHDLNKQMTAPIHEEQQAYHGMTSSSGRKELVQADHEVAPDREVDSPGLHDDKNGTNRSIPRCVVT